MSTHGACFDAGIGGNCGIECPAYLDGDCEIADELVEDRSQDMSNEDLENHVLLYGEVESKRKYKSIFKWNN